MKLTSTHLEDNTLFPLERKLLEPIDINLENQTHNTAKQEAALAEIDAFDSRLTQHFHNKIKPQPALTPCDRTKLLNQIGISGWPEKLNRGQCYERIN